jgi:hypothetical protein
MVEKAYRQHLLAEAGIPEYSRPKGIFRNTKIIKKTKIYLLKKKDKQIKTITDAVAFSSIASIKSAPEEYRKEAI